MNLKDVKQLVGEVDGLYLASTCVADGICEELQAFLGERTGEVVHFCNDLT